MILRVMSCGQHVDPDATMGWVRWWQHRVPPSYGRASRNRRAWREVIFSQRLSKPWSQPKLSKNLSHKWLMGADFSFEQK